MHIPSKAPPSLVNKHSKSPPSKITEVPSLLSKSRQKKAATSKSTTDTAKSSGADSLDIGLTKLDHFEPPPIDDNLDLNLSPKFIHRQYSEPDAKAIRDLARDLENLPPTPPFSAAPMDDESVPAKSKKTTLYLKHPQSPPSHFHPPPHHVLSPPSEDIEMLGLPTGLTYSKTTPLSYDHHEAQGGHGAYGHVNDPFFQNQPIYPHPPPAHRHQHQQQQHQHHQGGSSEHFYGDLNVSSPYERSGGFVGYNMMQTQPFAYPTQAQQAAAAQTLGPKITKRKKKKNKKQQQQQQLLLQQQQHQQQQQQLQAQFDFMGIGGSGFDFAGYDLNQQLEAIKQELNELDKKIEATDSETKVSELNLKQANAEKKKMLDGLKMEKIVLQKSLDLFQDRDDVENEEQDTQTTKKADVAVPPSKVAAAKKETTTETETSATAEGKHGDDDKKEDPVTVLEQYDDKRIREFWRKQCEDLRVQVDRFRTKNLAASASADVMHKHLRNQLEQTRKQLVAIKNERENNRNKNMQFELEVIELTEIVNNLKENVDSQRHDNFLKLNKQRERQKMEEMENEMEEESINKTTDADDERQKKEADTKAKADKVQSKNDQFLNLMPVSDEFPPEVVIQQNLIRAQVEFYFSDYNLKRDKRLLEKICKEPKRGYLEVNEVLNLSRVRQLCNSPSNLYDALKSSPYIHMILSPEEEKRRKQELQQQQEEQTKQADDNTTADKADDDDNDDEDKDKDDKAKDESTQYHPLYVGRKRFTPPTEKQFPFRRSVYIYGLPWYADEKYIYSMLNAFGGVTKVHFDHGPDTLDRQIMKKMLEKHRVYKLLSKDSAALTMEFNQMSTKQEVYNCYWCRKQKPCVDGYYHPKRLPGTAPSYRVCLQCAAAKAEEQSQKYDARSKLLKDDKRLRELLLGLPPRSIEQCKTALCVFASQRQASKCVYVRSRLAYDGAFATHYHHYSKLKKEIALSIKPKVRFIGDGSNKNKNKKAGDKDSTANNNNNYAATLKANKVQRTQPNMLKIITAPVYEQEGTAVIQPHVKTAKSNKNNTDNDANADTTTTIADQQKQQNK